MNSILSRARYLSISLILMFAISVVAVPSTAQESGVAIKVNDKSISKAKLNERVERTFKRMMSQYGDRMKNKKMRDRMKKRVRQRTIDKMVEELLLETQAQNSDVTVSSSEVERQLKSKRRRFKSKEEFRNALKKQGISPKQFKQRVRDDLLTKKFLEQKIGDVTVSDKEARDYFSKYEKKFDGSFQDSKRQVKRILRQKKQQDKRQSLVRKLREKSEVDIKV